MTSPLGGTCVEHNARGHRLHSSWLNGVEILPRWVAESRTGRLRCFLHWPVGRPLTGLLITNVFAFDKDKTLACHVIQFRCFEKKFIFSNEIWVKVDVFLNEWAQCETVVRLFVGMSKPVGPLSSAGRQWKTSARRTLCCLHPRRPTIEVKGD